MEEDIQLKAIVKTLLREYHKHKNTPREDL